MPAPDTARVRVTDQSDTRRHASWLELFFDLVFVASIANLAHTVGDDLTWPGLGHFGLLFVPLWWAWSNYSIYCDRFERDDTRHRLAMLAAMGAMAAVAVNIPQAFEGGSTAFVLSYVAMRLPLIALWNRARRDLAGVRPLATFSMLAFITGAGLWTLSLLLPEPIRFALWGLALGVEMATPWIFRRAFTGTPVHGSHLAERWGLFTIIVLGESFLSIILAADDIRWVPGSAVAAGLGFVAVAAAWWLYFGVPIEAALSRSLFTRNVFIFGHLPLTFGLGAASVGMKHVILAAGHGHPSALTMGLLPGGFALYLAASAVIRAAAAGRWREPTVLIRVTGAVAAAGVSAASPLLSPVATAALTVGVLVVLALAHPTVSATAERTSGAPDG